MHIAVIITTYNHPNALAAVLEGYLAQTDHDFEVQIADDGSGEPTAKLVREFQARAPFPIHHVWQQDEGFRAAAIRNRALAATAAEYVILTDGDCVPSRDFIAQHRRLAEPARFLSGNRMLLSAAFTHDVLTRHLPVHEWNLRHWLVARLSGGVNRLLPLLRLPDGAWRKRSPQRWTGVKTCNLSAWRADLLKVNGLDESYTGWGLEDSDLVIRLIRAGVLHKSARFAAPVFHLWHRENARASLEENRKRLEAVLHSTHTVAARGVSQYL
jgi:glycosyltransferase involved in cell wall biosynthesis